MKRIIFITICVFSTLVFSACGRRADHVDSNFIGVWRGSDGTSSYELIIDNKGGGSWHKSTGHTYITAQGVARVSHGKLHIGLRSFDIEQYPTLNTLTGYWSLQLSGVLYSR